MKTLDNKINKVGDELKANFEKGSKMSIISSYFSIYAFKELKKELRKVEELRFIFTEPIFKENTNEKISFSLENINNEELLAGNKYELKLRNELTQASIAKECAQWIKEKVQFKAARFPGVVGSKFMHIKNSRKDDLVINNTNDFSASGLGYAKSEQMIFANSVNDKQMTTQMLQMFDMFWSNDAMLEDVKDRILTSIERIYRDNTPEYLYFVTLYNIFKDYLDELTDDNIVKTHTGFKDTVTWNKLYKFQKDGVLGAIDKIEKYNGCIIADSVGLGKTFSALAVIKYYELRNDRVLVLCPKKLRDNWLVYTQNDKRNILLDDRFNYDVLNHTDLNRDSGMSGDIDLGTINWSNYDLVVIDESHNFRNNSARNNTETRYSKLMNEVIKKGVKTKVLMLSATPVNNRMNDIKNQIAFMTEGRDNAFEESGIRSIEITLRKAQTIFNKWSNLGEEERTLDNFLEQMNADYFKLLDLVTIARSRKHIEKYYNVKEIGKFPERMEPLNIKSDIDLAGEFPKLEEINKEIMRLKLAAYSPLSYVLPNKKDQYSKKYDIEVKGGVSVFKQTDRENSIIHLMRASILKRMESSIHSFGLTIAKVLKQVDSLIEKLEKDNDNYNPTVNINDINIEDSDLDNLLIGNKVKVLLQDVDKIKWKQDLEYDRDRLQHMLFEAAKVTKRNDDAKLNDLKKVLENKINNPINNGNKKVIIFTAFADTDEYINLEARVSGRMVLLDISATGEENIISTDEKKKMNDLEYRKKQLKKLQEEVVDLEDISGGISITDLTMNDFKMDLMDYLNNHREELEKAPKGMYSIVDIPESLEGQVKPGVIFCLKQINDKEKVKEFNNSLHPNYLVYVKNDGDVMYNHMHNKKILDFYKKLCSGKDIVLEELVNIFNEETNNGTNMNDYTMLLQNGISDVIGKKEEQGIMSLFTSGGTNLMGSTLQAVEDFEVISFLIIK